MVQSLPNDELTAQAVDSIAASNLLEVIETVITSLESDSTAMVHHDETAHLWKFKYGTVEVFVQLTGLSEEDTLTVWSTVLKLPTKDDSKLARQLLEQNWTSTMEARFAIVNNEVVVVTSRSLADLSPGEISRAITLVATIADESDEPLQQEFGR
ncbi:MAG: YbjN domain-containing protein [Leptolyngbyaceae cyanobacterium]|uniref:YbjN domain-containing protein n=1 Tax=Leptodesmis sichuanensis TaxID=2906798 RepID=UPI001F1C3CC1|nr:YbjN domain-containing protein [Leptodesmis sichuanensis]UIE39940.1 YbjN domain-containing protein [Leptodesmis sichuanensis A121]